MRFSRIVSALACAFVLNANAAPVEEYTQYLPDGANLALIVQKIGAGAPTIDYHSQQMALPASTQKVLTALAALLQLGPDYRFTTTLESQGDIRDGELRGNLIARFSGDPTFKRQSLRNMVAVLKKQGVRQISGDVLVDTSVFASHDKAPAVLQRAAGRRHRRSQLFLGFAVQRAESGRHGVYPRRLLLSGQYV